MKRLVLAYPPITLATAPPLGVCTLKGSLQKTLPDWQVRVRDLNLLMHEKLFDVIAARRYLTEGDLRESLLNEIALSRAAEVFRGKSDREFYYRPDRYSIYADLYNHLVMTEISRSPALEQNYNSSQGMSSLIEHFAQLVLGEQPEIIGISLCYTQQVWWGLCLGKALKARSAVPIVVGGTLFSTTPPDFLLMHRDAFDYVITGDAEQSLALFLENRGQPQNVPGLSWIKDGKLQTNAQAFAEDLDCLGHPDFSDLDLSRYFSPSPVLPILTSRGCFWRRCAFCTHYRSAGQTYREHSPSHIVEELRSHAAHGLKNFAFIDEMLSPRHIRQVAEAILEAKIEISYYAYAKPIKAFTPELLQLMRRSGCRYLIWGLESGCQRILDLMDKGTNTTDISAVLQAAHHADIINHVFLMAGFPTETKEEFTETLKFLYANKDFIWGLHPCQFNLERNSPVFDHPEKFSVSNIVQQGDYRSFGGFSYQCLEGMSHSDVEQAVGEAHRFLGSFNPVSGAFQIFRDHTLLLYQRLAGRINPDTRRIPAV